MNLRLTPGFILDHSYRAEFIFLKITDKARNLNTITF